MTPPRPRRTDAAAQADAAPEGRARAGQGAGEAPGAPGAPEAERPSLTTRTRERLNAFRSGLQEGLPFPLWCQGALEALQVLLITVLVTLVPALAAWASGAWAEKNWVDASVIGGQWWLSAHGVPLLRSADAAGGPGTLWFVPLGLSLATLALAWRAGRRLARASWSHQLWQGIAGAAIVYAVGGAVIGLLARSAESSAPWWAAALIPLIPVLLGLVAGARREAGSFGRLIGVDAADRIRRASQYSRWAGSYVWAVVRAGLIGWMCAFALAAVLLVVRLALQWVDVVNVALELAPGAVGGAVLAAGQAAYLPNLALWTLSWISGGGFSVGTGASFSPFEAHAGPLPSFPLAAALPSDLVGAWWLLAVPVVAGIVAGWWFLREGENHLEESLQLRFGPRWLALSASTLLLGLFVGAVAGLVSVLGSLLASGSWGIGQYTDLGPHVWLTGLLLTLEVGVGTMLGYLIAPLFERDPVLDA
ncbi:MAG: DUF6350 family protein [Arthrobacter sp.]|jgi:hypothetical protein|nr:DUF6350 family protein [Arthrobacter sp.]